MKHTALKVTLTSRPDSSHDGAAMSEALSRLYRATVSGVGEIVDSLSASERASIAVFCYGRVHLNAIGLAIAARCDLDQLMAAANSSTAGRMIYEQSRETPVSAEKPLSGRRSSITLATSVSRSLASRAAFAPAELSV